MSIVGNDFPARILWNPENIYAGVFVFVLFHPITFSDEFIVTLFKTIRNVLEKDEPEHNVFVLRCIHTAP